MPGLQSRPGTSYSEGAAHWKGIKNGPKTREEPNTILHELRVGVLANLNDVFQTPSYATVDATLLLLIAIARHVNWTGNLSLFDELRPNIDRVLLWFENEAAENEAGYVTYCGVSDSGEPLNQSWRDSGTDVLGEDGSNPIPPLELVEVQCYAYQARILIGALLRRLGEGERVDQLASCHVSNKSAVDVETKCFQGVMNLRR